MARNMSKQEIRQITENAEIIVHGYEFTAREDGLIGIANLNHPDCTMVVNRESEVIEASMGLIEKQIVLELCRKNLQFMGD